MAIFAVVSGILIVVLVYVAVFFATIFFGAPYIQSRRDIIEKIIPFAGMEPGQKAADLGAGNGKVIIFFAEKGIEAHGYEINPFLVLAGKRNIRKAGMKGRAFMHWKSFWNQDLSSFDMVYVYGFGHIMKKLEKKLKKTLRPRAKVVASAFFFPDWNYQKKNDNMYLYVRDK